MKFDAPIERCPHCNEYVLLDQTRLECAREHHCPIEACPLARYFRVTAQAGRVPARALPDPD